MAKTSLRAKLWLLGITLLIVPVLLLVAELCVRVFATRLDPLAVFVTSPQLRTDTQGENTGGMFEFDPLLTWRLRANLRDVWWDFTPVRTNGAHLRMDTEISQKKGLRIVCLGDSVTFGYRVPVAHDRAKPGDFDAAEKAYPQLVGESLRAKFPGREIEVLPLACPGYTSRQGLAWLRRDIAALKPDIVTACFGWNDARAAGAADRDTMPAFGSTQVTVRGVMAKSQLLLHIAASAQAKRNPTPAAPVPRNSAEEYTGHFAEMAALCRENGAWFGIVAPVFRDMDDEGARIADYRAQLRARATADGIPFLEVAELIESAGSTALFGERIHPNAAGHALLAKRLADFLAEKAGRFK